MTTLANSVGAALPPDDGLRFGVVATVNPLTVNVTGGLVPAGIQGSYAPAVGDTVSLIRQDGTWLITGRVGGPEMAYPTMVDVVADGVIQAGQTSTSYIDMTGTGGGISKASGASGLRVDMDMTGFVSVSGATISVRLLLTPTNGNAGYAPFLTWWRPSAATTRFPVGLHKILRGIAAGDYTFVFQWAMTNNPGGATYSRNADDTFSAILEER